MRKIIFIFAYLFLAVFAIADIYIPPLEHVDVFGPEGDRYITSYADTTFSATSTAIHKDSDKFVDWASGWKDVVYGSNCDARWRTPYKACGKATDSVYDIVCLGEGGRITMTFDNAIVDGDGYDFAVFENSFGDWFLELAFVEVSSDGEHFVRFPNFYLGSEAVGANGMVYASYVYNLASKYRVGYGHPFDLSELAYAQEYAKANPDAFSAEYVAHLEENLPYLDVNNVRYVRIIDISGDGNTLDSGGWHIYDPTPCTGSAGFDLEAIGVINSKKDSSKIAQSIIFADLPDVSFSAGMQITLDAVSTSGLEVSFEVVEGDASVSGNILTIGSSPSTILVKASQSGDDVYSAAAPVYKSFSATELGIQTITFAPIADRTPDQGTMIPLNARSSSGLKVSYEVVEGGADINVLPAQTYLVLSSSAAPQLITVRATQDGDETYAPAAPVDNTFAIVEKNSYDSWAADYDDAPYNADENSDGWANAFSYAFGLDPLSGDGSGFPLATYSAGRINISWRAAASAADASVSVQTSLDGGLSWTSLDASMTGAGIEQNDVLRSYAASISAPSYGDVLVRFSVSVSGKEDKCTKVLAPIKVMLSYGAWASANGLEADAAQPSATPMGDSISNLEKYALGLDASSSVSLSEAMGVSFEGGELHFKFRVFKYAQGVVVKVLRSSDLVDWTEIEMPQSASSDASFDYFDISEDTSGGENSPVFFRLQISQVEE